MNSGWWKPIITSTLIKIIVMTTYIACCQVCTLPMLLILAPFPAPPPPPLVFLLWLAFSKIHGSRRAEKTGRMLNTKPKDKNGEGLGMRLCQNCQHFNL